MISTINFQNLFRRVNHYPLRATELATTAGLTLSMRCILRLIAFMLFALLSVVANATISDENPHFKRHKADLDTTKLEVYSTRNHQAEFVWHIAKSHYLDTGNIKLLDQNQQNIALNIAKNNAIQRINAQHDAVYFNDLKATVALKPNSKYQLFWQQCTANHDCLARQKISFTTDKNTLIHSNNSAMSNHAEYELPRLIQQQSTAKNHWFITEIADEAIELDYYNDESIMQYLMQHALWINIVAFTALGILLAFMPCSLPLIPILSNLIVKHSSGSKRIIVALSFALSMAMTYAVTGLLIGYFSTSFSWLFQQAWVLIGFSLLYLLFALNLFGFFHLTLPSKILSRLNRCYSQISGGDVWGAVLMGILSAFIIGPCMTAPLAGALLYVSQLASPWHSGLFLFSLGFGFSLPIVIACLFGTKYLPVAGPWMNRLKTCFAIIMLLLALYFVQPLISPSLYLLLAAALLLLITAFLFISAFKADRHGSAILLFSLALFALVASSLVTWQSVVELKLSRQLANHHQINWHVVTKQTDLEWHLQRAKMQHKNAIVQIRGDECLACPVLKKHVFPNSEVQQRLAHYYAIKLDLSKNSQVQSDLFAKYQISTSPTVLIFDNKGTDHRHLRLIGGFSIRSLLQQLDQIDQFHAK